MELFQTAVSSKHDFVTSSGMVGAGETGVEGTSTSLSLPSVADPRKSHHSSPKRWYRKKIIPSKSEEKSKISHEEEAVTDAEREVLGIGSGDKIDKNDDDPIAPPWRRGVQSEVRLPSPGGWFAAFLRGKMETVRWAGRKTVRTRERHETAAAGFRGEGGGFLAAMPAGDHRNCYDESIVALAGGAKAAFHWPLASLCAMLTTMTTMKSNAGFDLNADASEPSEVTAVQSWGGKLSQELDVDWIWGHRTDGGIRSTAMASKQIAPHGDFEEANYCGWAQLPMPKLATNKDNGSTLRKKWEFVPEGSYAAALLTSKTSLFVPRNGVHGGVRSRGNNWFRISMRSRVARQSPSMVPEHDLFHPSVRGANIDAAVDSNVGARASASSHSNADGTPYLSSPPSSHDSSQRHNWPHNRQTRRKGSASCPVWADWSLEFQREGKRGFVPTFFLDAAAICSEGGEAVVVGSCGFGIHCGPLRLEWARHQAKTTFLVALK
jgi:hypothetical protein